jgi:hypothetical protein
MSKFSGDGMYIVILKAVMSQDFKPSRGLTVYTTSR